VDVCPFCGAEIDGYYYKCGTAHGDVPFKERTHICKDRQIANLQLQLADREERLEAWRETCEELIKNWKKPDANGWVEINVAPEDVIKLKALGEIT
jgi:hypothetical protein